MIEEKSFVYRVFYQSLTIALYNYYHMLYRVLSIYSHCFWGGRKRKTKEGEDWRDWRQKSKSPYERGVL